MAIDYKCSNCGSTRLKVDCIVRLDFRQTKTGNPYVQLPNLDAIGAAFWDNESTVYCKDCECWGSLLDARVDE